MQEIETYDITTAKESVLRKARAQFDRGCTLADCPMPFNSRAEKIWKDEWHRLNTERKAKAAE